MLRLEAGKRLRVVGPASVRVISGCLRIVGATYCRNEALVIPFHRSFVVKPVDIVEVDLALGEGASYEIVNDTEEVVDTWESIARRIAHKKPRIVVVLGPVESGKTTFATMLANIFLEFKVLPAIIDSDIGQNDLAPPGFVALKIINKKILWLRELKADSVRLVGALTPTLWYASSKLVPAIMSLINKAFALGASVVIINTDGWVHGYNAIEFKETLIRFINPDAIVVMGDDKLCTKITSNFKSREVHCLPRPPRSRERSRDERIYLRRIAYRMWFVNSRRMCLDMSRIDIIGSCVPYNVEQRNGLISMDYDDMLAVYTLGAEPIRPAPEIGDESRECVVISAKDVSGIISSLLGKSGDEICPALVEQIDVTRRRICVKTPCDIDEEQVRGIILGRIKLSEDFEEVRKHEKCLA